MQKLPTKLTFLSRLKNYYEKKPHRTRKDVRKLS